MKKKKLTHNSEIEELYFLKENERLIKKIHEHEEGQDNKNNVKTIFETKEEKSETSKKAA